MNVNCNGQFGCRKWVGGERESGSYGERENLCEWYYKQEDACMLKSMIRDMILEKEK